jgi:hypothetical protein
MSRIAPFVALLVGLGERIACSSSDKNGETSQTATGGLQMFPLAPVDGNGLTLGDGHRGVTEADLASSLVPTPSRAPKA